MDDDPARWLFDPTTARELVLARRPGGRLVPVRCVVSDVVWGDVVRLLRWASAATHGDPALAAGTWWRLAASCADLLRRLPGLSDELAEPWALDVEVSLPPDLSPTDRIEAAAGRLAALLLGHEPVPLRRLAAEVDALGAAAVSAVADTAQEPVGGRT